MMKKSTIWLLTIVMAGIIMGLLFVQIMYMENMIKMRNEQFSEVVMRSMYGVSTMLEQNETKYYLDQDLKEAEATYASSQQGNGSQRGSLPGMPSPINSDWNSSAVDLSVPTPRTSGIGVKDLDASIRSRQEILRGQYLYQRGMLNEVILTILDQSSDRPITERADSVTLRGYLKSELENNGLTLPFEFAVVSRATGLVYRTANYEPTPKTNVYTQVLFPNDPASKQNYLNVIFPTKNDYIFSSIKFMLPSFAFTFLLLGIFVYTIIMAFRQKKLAEMKADFINNMTHEFKTPISTISLAAQMLNDESVSKSPTMIKHTTQVIADETKRLRFQVEKVLQMSMFDRKKATMRLKDVDVNATIDNVVNTYRIKVERYGGKITTKLDAEDPIVNVDEMHFTNVIFNLLDNAIKYRREDVPPELEVTTSNPDDDTIVITVKDNGIGIKREDLKRIFEKFYRVSTGNRHDVKGFGLGLAYVSKMITLFNGSIKATSEYGKGSTFIITLPLYK